MPLEYVCEGCGVMNTAALDDAVAVRDELIESLRGDVELLELDLRLYRRRVSRALAALEEEPS